jgi:calcineurin-like phosphoesterase family protein
MNEDILQLFDRLPDNCDIWHLGDFWFNGNPKEFASDELVLNIDSAVKRIKQNGRRIFLVLGNHDNGRLNSMSSVDYYQDRGFDKVYDTPVILQDKWILSHEPVWIEPGSHFVNLYGHTHDFVIPEDYFCFDQENYAQQVREGRTPEMEWPERKIDLNNYRNVCLDHWHGIPEWKGDTLYVNEQHKIW